MFGFNNTYIDGSRAVPMSKVVSFTCLQQLKADQTTFFQSFSPVFSCFQPFFVDLNLFQWFHSWNQQKTTENQQKTCFLCIFPAPQSWSTCKSWLTPWGGTWNLSFSVDFLLFLTLFISFPLISLKKVKN